MAFQYFSHKKELENRNIEILSSGFERIPQTTKSLTQEQMAEVENLLEKIEADDDVQNVYSNAKIDKKLMMEI